ncbi:MAG: hypothetical protein ABEJ66_03490 [Candidatus Nanohaloarchaea archaeon]
MRKGLLNEHVARIAVGVALVAFVMTLGIEAVLDADEAIRLNTVDIAASRVSNSIYMAHSLERAKVELTVLPSSRSGDKGGYFLRKQGGKAYLVYKVESRITGLALQRKNGHRLNADVPFTVEEGRANTVCIIRNQDASKLKLLPGECSGY